MKTKLKLLCGALSLVLLLTACGGQTGTQAPANAPAPVAPPAETPAPQPPEAEPEAETGEVTVTGGAEAEALADMVLPNGTVLNARDCAIMIEYHFHIGDWPDEGEVPIDEVVKRGEAVAQANGYVPITAMGEGSKIYAVTEPWEDGVALIALGEDGTFKLCAQAAASGQNRRAAQKYIIWDTEDWNGWRVYSVEEQDYYEEDGRQYPCLYMALIPNFD